MKAEFRTLDGAIAMREVAEPLPERYIVPLWIHGAWDDGVTPTPTRAYLRSITKPYYYTEAHEMVGPPAHATEVERIADVLRNNRYVLGHPWNDAMRDLRSLGKRYFGHTESVNKTAAEVRELQDNLTAARNLAATYRQQYNEGLTRESRERMRADLAVQQRDGLVEKINRLHAEVREEGY